MSDELVTKLTSRKLWAFAIGVTAAFLYALHLIDAAGMGAIVASVAAYNVGEGLADMGQGKAQVDAAARAKEQEVYLQHVANSPQPVVPPVVLVED